MKYTRLRSYPMVVSVLAAGVGVPQFAFAQAEPAPPSLPAPATSSAPEASMPVAAPVVAPAAAPEAAAAPAVSAAAPAAPEAKWYEQLNLGAFVDGYYSQNWNTPRSSTNANSFHPYSNNTGFNLAWVGVDASVDPAPVGATLQLRFGPATPNLALGDASIPGGIGYVQNGFVSWKPQGKEGNLTLILGKFDTVFGAEVAQSHLNMNYTRGYLYNLAQPFFHTGLRADWVASDLLTVKLLAVNGWNNTIDNNQGKSFGAQVTLTPAEMASFSLGYLGGPEDAGFVANPDASKPGQAATVWNPGADSRWRHLVDFVADIKPTKDFRIVANGDYVTQKTTAADITQSWYGAALLARYAFSDVWAAAVRGEYIKIRMVCLRFPAKTRRFTRARSRSRPRRTSRF